MVEDGVRSYLPLEIRLSKQYDIMGYDLKTDKVSLENLQRAMVGVLASLEPMPLTEIKQRLTAMTVLLAIPKDFNEDVLILKRDTLAAKLQEWPADVVADAIMYMERNCKFFPTYAEFVEYMGWRVQPRYFLHEELQKSIEHYR